MNPIDEFDESNRDDRSKWLTQHDGLKDFDPPYVYNVRKNDTEGFLNAIGAALANPISSTVLPRMRQSEVDKRVKLILESDFRRKARLVYWTCRAQFWKDQEVSREPWLLVHTLTIVPCIVLRSGLI